MTTTTAITRQYPSKWSDEARQEIKALWSSGLTGNAIAQHFGVSRNAILGIVDRMGLMGHRTGTQQYRNGKVRTKKIKAAQRPPKAAKPKVKPGNYSTKGATPAQIAHSRQEWEELQAILAARPDVARVQNIVDLEPHQCRWPIGDRPYAYCGDHKVQGRSYCTEHLMRSTDRHTLLQQNNYLRLIAFTADRTQRRSQDADPEKDIAELTETVAA